MPERFNYDKYIQSRGNPLVGKYASLSTKKHREKEALFLAEGVKLTEEASESAEIECVLVCEDALGNDRVVKAAESCGQKGAEILLLSGSAFEKITTESAPQGIISVVKYMGIHRKIADTESAESLYENEKIMVLSSIQDPGNLGTIMRSAAAFGIDKLILSSDCADVYNPKTVRASMGAVYKVATDTYNDLEAAFAVLQKKGRRVFSACPAPGAYVLGKYDMHADDCIVIGNEGHGIPENLIKKSDGALYIPMCENAESLNAALAASIIMWEMSKFGIDKR